MEINEELLFHIVKKTYFNQKNGIFNNNNQ